MGEVRHTRMIVHLKRSWGDDASICGRVGMNAEAVLAPELVTCKRCLRLTHPTPHSRQHDKEDMR
jgi:hypothetical protein